MRLIRSKGVSVWFITQNPSDVPESVLGQLGNRVQHALRAYTPNEQRAVRYAARSFRSNPAFDTERTLQELAVGEALVSVLDPKGVPTVVEKAGILPPRSSMNAVNDGVIESVVKASPLSVKYDKPLDRESAYEMLAAAREEAEKAAERQAEEERKQAEKEAKAAAKTASSSTSKSSSTKKTTKKKSSSAVGKVVSSTVNSMGREIGRQLIRGLFGTFKK